LHVCRSRKKGARLIVLTVLTLRPPADLIENGLPGRLPGGFSKDASEAGWPVTPSEPTVFASERGARVGNYSASADPVSVGWNAGELGAAHATPLDVGHARGSAHRLRFVMDSLPAMPQICHSDPYITDIGSAIAATLGSGEATMASKLRFLIALPVAIGLLAANAPDAKAWYRGGYGGYGGYGGGFGGYGGYRGYGGYGGGGYGRGYGIGPGIAGAIVGLGVGAAIAGAYAPSYYAPPPVIYAPPPVVYAPAPGYYVTPGYYGQ